MRFRSLQLLLLSTLIMCTGCDCDGPDTYNITVVNKLTAPVLILHRNLGGLPETIDGTGEATSTAMTNAGVISIPAGGSHLLVGAVENSYQSILVALADAPALGPDKTASTMDDNTIVLNTNAVYRTVYILKANVTYFITGVDGDGLPILSDTETVVPPPPPPPPKITLQNKVGFPVLVFHRNDAGLPPAVAGMGNATTTNINTAGGITIPVNGSHTFEGILANSTQSFLVCFGDAPQVGPDFTPTTPDDNTLVIDQNIKNRYVAVVTTDVTKDIIIDGADPDVPVLTDPVVIP